MNRFVEHRSSVDSSIAARRPTPDRLNLSAYRMQGDGEYARSLTSLIESEIIPRMMVAHTTGLAVVDRPDSVPVVRNGDIDAFAPLVMQVEADELLVHVEAMLERGVSFESVLVDLLAPTARLLGEFWEHDTCDFVDVTMGLWRLQEVIHEISARQPLGRPPGSDARRALFAPMPGDQHSLGTVMIDDIFRREGWLTDRLCEVDTAELLHWAQTKWFDVIGLTVTCDCHIGALPQLIAALRKKSRNPQVCVLVGGRVFNADPDLAVQVGADGSARDAKYAPQVADGLVRQRERASAA